MSSDIIFFGIITIIFLTIGHVLNTISIKAPFFQPWANFFLILGFLFLTPILLTLIHYFYWLWLGKPMFDWDAVNNFFTQFQPLLQNQNF